VVAHTLPERSPSTSVLERCRFARAGEDIDPEEGPVWRWELRLGGLGARHSKEMATGEVIGIHHIKIPVTDLGASREWYERVFDLDLALEFPDDDDVVRGVAYEPKGGFALALRENADAARGIAGYDPFAILVQGLADIEAWVEHLDALAVEHSPVMTGMLGWALAFHDPDGLELRLYTADRRPGARA
jgi:catechol 2,3-dioxygenase-like lactoylglutathione lyase family enzyme